MNHFQDACFKIKKIRKNKIDQMKINAEENSQALKKLICNTDMQFIN